MNEKVPFNTHRVNLLYLYKNAKKRSQRSLEYSLLCFLPMALWDYTVHSPLFSLIFYSIIDYTDRIRRELDACGKRETWQGRGWEARKILFVWLASFDSLPLVHQGSFARFSLCFCIGKKGGCKQFTAAWNFIVQTFILHVQCRYKNHFYRAQSLTEDSSSVPKEYSWQLWLVEA